MNKTQGINTNINNLYSEINSMNSFIKHYLLNNLYTIELMKVIKINDDNTVNLETILQNVFTNGEISETKSTLYNINVMMLKGGDISLSFQVAVGDIGLYLSFKKDFSNYLNNIDNTTLNKDIFKYTNGVFLPLSLNNTTNNLTIKNKNTLIELKENEINITGATVNINGNLVINGDLTNTGNTSLSGGGQGVARINDAVDYVGGTLRIIEGSTKVVAG